MSVQSHDALENHKNEVPVPLTAQIERLTTREVFGETPERFEKLYLAPETLVKGQLRRTFGNPTPVALAGFLLANTRV